MRSGARGDRPRAGHGRVLLLLFVAYQLWGTGIYQARAQNDAPEPVRDTARGARPDAAGARPPPPCPTTRPSRRPRRRPTHARRRSPSPPNGDAVARIRIAKIGWYGDPGRGRGRRRRRPPQGPGPLPGDAAARPGGQRRHRRPPHHLRRAVRRPRPARPRATRSSCTTVQGTFTYDGRSSSRSSSTRTRSSVLDPGTRSRATRPLPRDAHAHHLQPEVLRRRSGSSSRRRSCCRRAQAAAPAEPRHHAGPAATTIGGLSGDIVVADSRDPLGAHRRDRSGCSGGCSSTATRAGRRGSSAWSRSSSRSSCSTCTSSACCRRTTDAIERASGLVDAARSTSPALTSSPASM